ncbi:hypothetical protein, partial [Okeania sp. SIO2B9]|uniref:hypothetical protein n=1 Tax=Okeania sp. SIO2B9 TaxID=2607782 RepID=UPI00257D95C4
MILSLWKNIPLFVKLWKRINYKSDRPSQTNLFNNRTYTRTLIKSGLMTFSPTFTVALRSNIDPYFCIEN